MGATNCPLTKMIADTDDTVREYIEFLEFFFYAPNDDLDCPKQFFYANIGRRC
jgi:hypothetical protein